MFRNFLNVMLGCFLSLRPLPCISPFALDSLIIDPFFACLCYALVCLGFFSLHVFLELILYLSVLLHIISLVFYNSNCSSTHFFSQYLFPSFVCQCFHPLVYVFLHLQTILSLFLPSICCFPSINPN